MLKMGGAGVMLGAAMNGRNGKQMLNRCEFIGNLGAEPEIRSFSNGGKVANLRLAVSKKWKDREGQKREVTEWVTIVINGDGLVGVAERFLRKGSRIYVAGELRNRKWADKDGNDRYTTEIVVGGHGGQLLMLDGPSGNRDGGSGGGDRGGASGWGDSSGVASNGGSRAPFGSDLDDDVPFN